MLKLFRGLAASILVSGPFFAAPTAQAADPIKVAFIGPFSGTFAASGDAYLKMLTFAMNNVNARGGALGRKFEIKAFDDKIQPAEALIQLKAATDENIPVVIGGIGSNVAAAMEAGVKKYNRRNPDHRVLYINIGALSDPLTEENCDFWHFRIAANVSQRVATLARNLPKTIKTVYLMNQDYMYGHDVARATRKFLKMYRPDVKIAASEFVPLGKIKDFSSYVPKIKASGAQAIITSNWGPDFNLLVKAGNEAGLDLKYFTLSAHLNGAPTAMGDGGGNRAVSVMEGNDNIGAETNNATAEDFVKRWRATNPGFDYVWVNFQTMFDMLATAIDKSGSTKPLKIALALEGMQVKDMYGKVNTIRKADHQLLTPLYTALFTKPVKYDSEGTGWGWKTEGSSSAKDLTFPTKCKMKRPKGA
ncbi:MAG: branched-chain amino acid ABC transporter substrate-binding protein [Hyphomicrobiaceae bacterium]